MTNSPDYPIDAVLQVRSSLPGENPRQVLCQFGSLAKQRLTLISRDRVRVATAVSVEYDDKLLLGEVMACTEDCDGCWHLELKVEHVLTGLQSLMMLRERLLGESVSSRVRPLAAAALQR